MMWRHGDVLIASLPAIPEDAQRQPGSVLAYGEVTGHSHRIETPAAAELWEANGELFLKVIDVTRVIHEEHHPITLPPGTYRVWQQREYVPTPQAFRRVTD
ncbi:MAG TPA: hypothetical protein VFB60_14690 [Ktedonobacteraceae bacterium]|nr:hypothetical protein [Ktedonobacteraceae bacterium]